MDHVCVRCIVNKKGCSYPIRATDHLYPFVQADVDRHLAAAAAPPPVRRRPAHPLPPPSSTDSDGGVDEDATQTAPLRLPLPSHPAALAGEADASGGGGQARPAAPKKVLPRRRVKATGESAATAPDIEMTVDPPADPLAGWDEGAEGDAEMGDETGEAEDVGAGDLEEFMSVPFRWAQSPPPGAAADSLASLPVMEAPKRSRLPASPPPRPAKRANSRSQSGTDSQGGGNRALHAAPRGRSLTRGSSSSRGRVSSAASAPASTPAPGIAELGDLTPATFDAILGHLARRDLCVARLAAYDSRRQALLDELRALDALHALDETRVDGYQGLVKTMLHEVRGSPLVARLAVLNAEPSPVRLHAFLEGALRCLPPIEVDWAALAAAEGAPTTDRPPWSASPEESSSTSKGKGKDRAR